MVPLPGIEPGPAAYLALTGYKSAALPIELQGQWLPWCSPGSGLLHTASHRGQGRPRYSKIDGGAQANHELNTMGALEAVQGR